MSPKPESRTQPDLGENMGFVIIKNAPKDSSTHLEKNEAEGFLPF
jgi:hypothetical protein